MPILLLLYQLLTVVFGTVIYTIISYRRRLNGYENNHHVQERYGLATQQRTAGPLIWFHAVSNGEAMAALAVIKILQAKYLSLKFLITTGTPTSAALIQQNMPGYVQHQYVPFDVPRWINRFLDHWQPQMLVIIESEIWPNLITQVVRRSVPIILLNGCMSEKTFHRWRFCNRTSYYLMNKFNLIVAQSAHALHQFKQLGAPNVYVMNNIKFLGQPLNYLPQALDDLQHQIKTRPIWLAASTHPGEEQMIIDAHKLIKAQLPNLLTIIIPRHPIRAPEICQLLTDCHVTYRQRLQQQPITDQTQIYLADSVGELGLFYRLGHIVFLGGSLVNVGGHNLIEPAMLDNAIIHGPHMHKQTDILQSFNTADALIKITDSQSLAQTVINLLSDQTMCQDYQRKSHSVVDNQQAITDDLLYCLQPFITKIVG